MYSFLHCQYTLVASSCFKLNLHSSNFIVSLLSLLVQALFKYFSFVSPLLLLLPVLFNTFPILKSPYPICTFSLSIFYILNSFYCKDIALFLLQPCSLFFLKFLLLLVPAASTMAMQHSACTLITTTHKSPLKS